MELQFTKSVCQCLHKVTCQTVSQEQTQELRLPDTLPDIGRILGSWGQTVIRSKEWRGNGMQVTGGVMAWVLYASEDTAQPQVLNCWIPMQLKWDFPQTQRDGTVCVLPSLKSVDARTLSARKMMVRAVVSVLGEAMEPMEWELFAAPEMPQDVALLIKTYPILLPMEAGEKVFQLEEELQLPGNVPQVEKVVHYCLDPVVTEQKVLANRLVFRGTAYLRLVYLTQESQIAQWTWELPFSQYTDLDKDYSPNALAWTAPIVTSLELEPAPEEKWTVKAGMAVQYVIQDRVMAMLTQDAYSPIRKVELEVKPLNIPMELDNCQQSVPIRGKWEDPANRILDAVWYHGQCAMSRNGDTVTVEIPGQFQVLYQDAGGQLQGSVLHTEDSIQIPCDPGSCVDAYISCQPATGELAAEASIQCAVTAAQGMNMVTGVTLGEPAPKDPKRPSVILRRAGDGDLWSIAKASGSTVEAIQKANGLDQEPAPEQMLLIPIS